MTVVAKFHCHSVSPNEHSTEGMHIVRLGAVWAPKVEGQAPDENAIFGSATPWAECQMGITNEAAYSYFKPGRKYRVMFEEVEEQQ